MTGELTVVFLGDSITRMGDEQGGFVATIRETLKPGAGGRRLPLRIVGAGIDGNKTPDLLERLDRDVIALRPRIVVLFIGINDVWHHALDDGTPLARYSADLVEISARLARSGARVILCTPSVIGERTDGTNPFDAMLDEYSSACRQAAVMTMADLVDLRWTFLEALRTRNPENRDTGILTGDGVHLNDAGNAVVAAAILPVLRAMLDDEEMTP